MVGSNDHDTALAQSYPSTEVTVGVVNDAGFAVEILWVDALTNKRETVGTMWTVHVNAESHHMHWVRTYVGV